MGHLAKISIANVLGFHWADAPGLQLVSSGGISTAYSSWGRWLAALSVALLIGTGGDYLRAQQPAAPPPATPAPGVQVPGIDAPQVDLMWVVTPDRVVEDNYGHYISTRYYVIEVVIGNNSQYELYLVTVGFQRQETDPSKTEPWPGRWLIPANGYKMVRGSLERGQEFGSRSKAVNAIKAVGLIGAGFTPFFHNVGHSANWSKGVNLFSDPFEKGFEIVVPDRTIRYLARLDDQALKDGMLIPHNHQERTRVYVAKGSLYSPNTKPESDPDKVKQKLGRMKLVGQVLTLADFAARQHVEQTTSPTTAGTAPSTPATTGVPAPKPNP